MSKFGYGYTNRELKRLASDTAVFAGKRPQDSNILGQSWFEGFLKRHPDLKGLKPRSLTLTRAKAVSEDVIDNYYTELKRVLDTYNLHDKPHRIMNIDETGISPEHSPPNIIGLRGTSVPAVTSPRGANTTVIACCSATGISIPPFFVFKGKRQTDELANGALPGTGICMSETGWSNSEIFSNYITSHLSKHIPGGIGEEYTLLLYDGATSHITPSLVEWAKEKKVILMVLPAHSSHLTQPLDVGVFRPFKAAYNSECQEFMRSNVGRSITRYDICSLVCKAYTKSFTPANILSSFRKTGIVPFNREVIAKDKLLPNLITTGKVHSPTVAMLTTDIPVDVPVQDVPTSPLPQTVQQYLQRKVPKFVPPFKRRKTVTETVITSGKEITNTDIASQIISKGKAPKKIKKPTLPKKKVVHVPKSTQPGPSNSGYSSFSDTDDDEISDSEKCCVCKQYTPEAVRQSSTLKFATWVECSTCGHWVHLIYCTDRRVIRKGEQFFCIHCSPASEE